MSEQDIHAAVERWKRVRNGEEIKDVYGMMKPDWTPAKLSADCDACDLADAYVELLDDTPLTDEWVGEQCNKHGLYFDLDEYENAWAIAGPCENLQLRTRGQLRALLLAMGVKHD